MIRIRVVSPGRDGMKKVLRGLREGCIVVVDRRLTPVEEAELIRKSLGKFSKGSSGVEILNLPGKGLLGKGRVSPRMFVSGKGLALVGPSGIVKRKNMEFVIDL